MEDQVLNMVVQIEDPNLKQSRIKLLIELNGLRKEMDDLDKAMLTELSESEGNLLDNDALMKRLTDIKAKLTEVDEKLLEVEESEADILRLYEEYRPVATRGSLLYFAVLDMARLNKMYQVSMAMFDAIVEKAIKNTGGPNSPGPAGYEDRISMMTRKVTRAVLKFYPLCYARQHQIVFEICVALRLGLSEQVRDSPSAD
jgi:dynein heavy chain